MYSFYTRLLTIICFGIAPLISIGQEETNELNFINLFSAEDKEHIACYRIPALITATNGDLIAAIDERVPSCGDLKLNKDINIVLRRSTDNGKTWTPIERIVDYPWGASASDPSLLLDQQTGELFMFYNYMNLDTEKDIYYLKYVSSMDHGRTWSEPVDITEQITTPEWRTDFKFITSGRGIQTSAGELVHTLVNLENGLHLFKSIDHGKNWSLINTPILPANESKIVELDNGNWMVNSRVTEKGFRYVHISADEGRSWKSRPEPQLADPSCNASIIRYSSNQKEDEQSILLFSNANSAKKREHLTVKVSYDEGETWSRGKTIYLGSSAYSSMTVLANGDIGLFFEKDGYRENVFVSFSLTWLEDDK